jgi:hypothetical protein
VIFSSVLLDLSAITLSEIRAIRNADLTTVVRQTIDAAARDYVTTVQMQDE